MSINSTIVYQTSGGILVGELLQIVAQSLTEVLENNMDKKNHVG